MSLLTEQMEPCTIIDRVTSSDGYGGYNSTWQDGATIQCAIVLDSSLQARVAETAGVKDLYTITTTKNINLQYHQVLRRELDGKILRVTSNGDDKKTPNSAGLDIRQVHAEEWSLKNDE